MLLTSGLLRRSRNPLAGGAYALEKRGKPCFISSLLTRAPSRSPRPPEKRRNDAVTIDAMGCQERHDWPGLRGIVMIESTREIGEEIERETRFNITSLVLLAYARGAGSAK